ncbi:MAG: ATP-binding cassette domain-containing protein [Acholeplasma sp.]|nr:ATP-binding cassette domain-containing protein [Acholeplasma sp.]
MLELQNIKKDYIIGNNPFTALIDINLTFKKSEFVAILGPSGCGKTTLLNLIGGLDQYTSGDLIIENKSTKSFSDSDWDAYRNNKVGFIFQNYHLINHISILENVELGMTLAGKSASERRQKAIEVLKRVGLEDQMYKRSKQLSGGQKQRVAIARALANDPEIILADEPTGALDTKTSTQILELIKEISKEKLVIMVTHNQELADLYASRIITLLDGRLQSDSSKEQLEKTSGFYQPKKTSMSYFQAIKLSFNNLRTKLARTVITAFAGSIGIIGVLLVLGVGNGFNKTVNSLEKEALVSIPIRINQFAFTYGPPDFNAPEPVSDGFVYPYDSSRPQQAYQNNISSELIAYINQYLDPSAYTSIELDYGIQTLLLQKENTLYKMIEKNDITFGQTNVPFLNEYFEVMAGSLANTEGYPIYIVLNDEYGIDKRVLEAFNLPTDEKVRYEDLIGKTLVSPLYDDYYVKDESSILGKTVFSPNTDLSLAFNQGIVLEVKAVLAPIDDNVFTMSDGVYHLENFNNLLLQNAKESVVGQAQMASDYYVIDFQASGQSLRPKGTDFLVESVERTLVESFLGTDETPVSISIYPTSYQSKEQIIKVLDDYNEQTSSANKIVYLDLAETIGSALGSVVNMISIVLVIFAGISLVVSSIMIGIITYVSVIERTQEIGVLRALGARKKDVKRVFNSETFLIGLTAGLLGSLIAYILSFPINAIVYNLNNQMKDIMQLTFMHVASMVIVSILLTFVAGLFPASLAAKKNPVEALRAND